MAPNHIGSSLITDYIWRNTSYFMVNEEVLIETELEIILLTIIVTYLRDQLVKEWQTQQIWPPIYGGTLNNNRHLSSIAPSKNMATNRPWRSQQIWPLYGLMVACPFWALVVLYWILALFTLHEMINVWDTIAIFIRLPRMFLSKYFLFEKGTWQITTGLLYIRFTYQTKDNQQECSRLIILFSCVVLRAAYEPLASSMVVHFWIFNSKWQLVSKYGTMERNFVLISCPYYFLL